MAHQTVGVRVPARDLAILGAIVVLLAFFGFAIVHFGGALKASQVPQPTSAERLPGPVVQLEPFTVSLIGAETTTLLRVKLVLELDDWKTVAEIKRHLAPVQLITSSILAEQTYDSIRNVQGKQLLRTRLHQSINSTLPDGGVKAVYFRELLYE